MIFAGTRPKHTVFVGDALITDACVIGHAADGSVPQLTKGGAGLAWEIPSVS